MSLDAGTMVLVSFALSLSLTVVAERVALRVGMVARPSSDRWHRQTVPLLGGIPIVVGTIAPALLMTPEPRILVLAGASVLMAGLGFWDDLRSIAPQTKLLGQILLAALLLGFGFELRLTQIELVDLMLGVFWLVGVTNAFNLLDNMDGLSATIALVAAAFRFLFFFWDGDASGAMTVAAFAGAVGGFLVRNWSPARIFMGDTGSLFLGFFLAGLSISAPASAYSRGLVAVLVIPVLLLLIPVFDTAFVTVTRVLSGRSPAQGGRDHTSHRLVAIGLTERQTVLLLAAVSAAGGGVAVLSYRVGLTYAVALLGLLLIGLVLFGVHLSRIHTLGDIGESKAKTVVNVLIDFQYKRQVATVVLDAMLIPLAYYAAYLIRFEDAVGPELPVFTASLPVVLLLQLGAFASLGLYAGVWQFTSIADLWRITKGIALGTMASVLALFFIQHTLGLSRTVFVLYAVLLLVLVGGSRISFRVFAEVLRAHHPSFGRVLIYGAGLGGELVVRELRNNRALERIPVGFLDDDRGTHASRIHGVPVLGGSGDVERVLEEHGITEVIISSAKINGNGLAKVTEVCRQREIPVRRATLRLE